MLAKRKLDAVTAEVYEAHFKLESSPSTTAGLANFLSSLDEVREQVRHTHSCSNYIFSIKYY